MFSKTRFSRLRSIVCCLGFFAIAGCGGGSGSNSGGRTATVLRPGVVQLAADSSVTISGLTDSGLTITGNVPVIQPGNTLVETAGHGFIRKVISVTPITGGVNVQTSNGNLTDVFEQTGYTLSKALQSADFESVTATYPGVSVTQGRSTRDSGFTLSYDFKKMPLSGPADNPTVYIDGNMTLAVHLDIDLQIRHFAVQKFRCVEGLDGSVTANLKVAATDLNIKKDIQIGEIRGAPIPGPLGIPLVPTILVYLRASGSVSTGLVFSPSATVSTSAGVEYDNGSGWQNIASLEKTFTLPDMPNVYASFKADISPVSTEFGLEIAGIAGPTIHVDMPYGEVEFNAQTSPPSVEAFGRIGVKASAGVHAEIFGFSADYSTPDFIDQKIDVFHRVFNADGSIKLGIN